MTQIILLNKPYGVLTQFSDHGQRPTLKNYIDLPNIYPAGRLDRDSEGLVILTDDGRLQHQISHPRHKLAKTYWVQVENTPSPAALQQLRDGVELKDGKTQPAEAQMIDEPNVWPRTPPIRFRADIPSCWISLTIREGRNRQVRRMTAAIGHPTLRLIRSAVGPWTLEQLQPGQWHCSTLNPFNTIAKETNHDLETTRHRRRHHSQRRTVPDGRGNKRRSPGH